MMEFIQALQNSPLLQHALIAGILASIACGVIGTYVVVRRMTFMAGGIAHCVLGGLGAALYLQKAHGLTWLQPMYGAVAVAVAAALVIGYVSLRARSRADTIIGALWALGVAAGVLFIYQTPGYETDLMSYLFGNIVLVSKSNLYLLAVLDAVVVVVGLVFCNHFTAVCFDEEFAAIRGLRTRTYYLLLLCLMALTVVLLMSVVGVVMVIALLTLPVAAAGRFSRSILQMMAISTLISSACTTVGLAASYGPGLPPGATIIVLAGAFYLAIAIAARLARVRRLRASSRRAASG